MIQCKKNKLNSMILNQILLKKEKKTNQIYNLQGSKIDLLN
jgi:hypothetical protein